MTAATGRLVLFLVVTAAFVGWLSAGNHAYASAARFFLKELFRQMF